jgi:chromosome segregation ATPase
MTEYITKKQANEILMFVGGTWDDCIRDDNELLYTSMKAAIQRHKNSQPKPASVEEIKSWIARCHAAGDLSATDAQAKQIEAKDVEILRLQHEVVNRNQRALDGDKAVATLTAALDREDAMQAVITDQRQAITQQAEALAQALADVERLQYEVDAIQAIKEERDQLRAQLAALQADPKDGV